MKPTQEQVIAWAREARFYESEIFDDIECFTVLVTLAYEAGRKEILCGCGDQIMPDDGAECGNCVTARNAVKPQPVAQVHVAEDYYPHVIWAEGVNPVDLDQKYLYVAPPQSEQGCAECGKKAADGWALYCVKCSEPMREWVGLTDEEIKSAASLGIYEKPLIDFARAIEAKLKEKNT